ncbi:MAG TPA: MOSC domain-containing protein, partial [Trueperaceae bacterium]|nr:MOSC domain-containing protein [Trueperaceae bacterium]
MKVLSVNISAAKTIKVGNKEVKTGHLKEPQHKPIKVTKLGLEGDVQVDKKNHGGKDQAVYFYSKEDYEFWEKELARSLELGLFGENLSISGISTLDVKVGDRLKIA